MDDEWVTTSHARQRQARRNLSDDDIEFVIAHGQRKYCGGAVHYFLGRRNLPTDRATYQRYSHLEGTVLVMREEAGAWILITTYRNRSASRHFRQKTRYSQPRNH
jgi:hypothetical protein